MTRPHWIKSIAALVAAAIALAYLYDPPWIGAVTSGLRPWEQDPPGTFFRWTAGRASFYVPSSATTMIVPLRAVFPGPNGTPVRVEIRDNGRSAATILLTNPEEWVQATVPLAPAAGRRRFRRIDLRISRVVEPFALGVMTGEIVAR
jgi:hypothetical protein